ncbi:MAG: serine hydrolase [Prolixibacteraceae bacterium]
MFQKILLVIIFMMLSGFLFAQKKAKPVHAANPVPVVHPIHPTKIVAVSVISPERKNRLLQREEAKKALVVLRNESNLLPLNRLDTLKTLVVCIGMGKANPMPQLIGRYIKADYLTVPPGTKYESIRRNFPKSASYNLIILAIVEQDSMVIVTEEGRGEAEHFSGKDFEGVTTVMMAYGRSGFLTRMTEVMPAAEIVVTGKVNADRLDLSAQLLFGAISSSGKLPFELNRYRKGEGIFFPAAGRLSYVLPEELGMDSVKLAQKMDSLVGIGLKANAFPGCQLLLAKKGMVFYNKSYGFHRYNQREPVLNDDIYDLASVTKVLGPVPALMMLADQRKFLVTQKMSNYWSDWKGSNKEGILVSDLLSHQARLKSGVVLYPQTLDGQGGYKQEYYAIRPSAGHDLRVAENLYLIDSYRDSVYKVIRDSPLLKTKKYAYSDLGFVILPKVIENLSGETYETFLQNKLYDRLGVSTLMYNPWLHVPREKIVPTEDDRTFRHDLLQGFVHDETAAMMGGISGNAGLFGSAGDVAKVMQLYLQNGQYGNERYITAETLKVWTSSHFQKTNNRRGFGFDKPGIQTNKHTGKERYPSSLVSEQSYGHSGFTGTFVWADPMNELLFIFLSNRVFPDRDNHKINKLRLRPMLLESFFRLAGDVPSGH